MKSYLKITESLLKSIKADLVRPHAFAHERVGFIYAGATRKNNGDILLLARNYTPIGDEDYVRDHRAGAVIGHDAIRKGLQRAYKSRSSVIHIHTHGGFGKPEFSSIDLNSAYKFIPSFFNPIPQMPHGIMVLSNDSARGLFWFEPDRSPLYMNGFISVGTPYAKFGE